MNPSGPYPPYNRPISNRSSNFFVDRKIISVDSVDRDIMKWPHSSQFEVQLPEPLINVSTIRLIDVNIPSTEHMFAHRFRNTKLQFRIQPRCNNGGTEKDELQAFFDSSANVVGDGIFEATIRPGTYTVDEFANELEFQLNDAVTKTMIAYSEVLDSSYVYENWFHVIYHAPRNRFIFVNARDHFHFVCNKESNFDSLLTKEDRQLGSRRTWNDYSHWGLGFNLGFEQLEYESVTGSEYGNGSTDTLFKLSYDSSVTVTADNHAEDGLYVLEAPNHVVIDRYQHIYVELDKYNSIDEIDPYANNTSAIDDTLSSCNTDNNCATYAIRRHANTGSYSGNANASFAKIPLVNGRYTYTQDNRNGSLTNIAIFKSPVPKIYKMKFRFRYHDGTLVDFGTLPYSLTFEINQMISDVKHSHELNTPFMYGV